MIYWLLLSLFSQDEVLVKQHDVVVTVGDLDSYVFMLPPDKRGGFAKDPVQIEKNIISILNMNIVYDYVIESDYNDHEVFKPIVKLVNELEIPDDDSFVEKLNLDKDKFEQQFRSFLAKREYYVRLKSFLSETIDEEKLEMMAKERFLVNSAKWTKPEKRSLSVITLDKEQHKNDVVQILTDIISTPTKSFEDYVAEYSNDPTAEYNQGNWSEFRKEDFHYPFNEEVFSADTGVIPAVFEYEDKYYLIKVNEIIGALKPKFEDYKEDLMTSIKSSYSEREFQNIINAKAINKPEINPENAAQIFERFKVFIEE